MVRKLIAVVFGLVLVGSLLAVSTPAQAGHKKLEVYSEGPFGGPYEFTNEDCPGLPFEVKGRDRGYEVLYIVPGSDGQAFLLHERYRFREVWTNPANGKKAYVSGHHKFREVKATHVEGNVWRFLSVLKGKPFVVKNARHKTVLAEWGKLVLSSDFDTLGDSQPGGELVSQTILKSKGNWPTWEEDFDFCALVDRVIG